MDWNSLVATVTGPYGALIGVAVVVVYSLARQRWPQLPGLPVIHQPNATPPAEAPTFPYVRKLLGLNGDVSATEIPATVAAKLRDEIAQLIDHKVAAHQAEAAALTGQPVPAPAPTAGATGPK